MKHENCIKVYHHDTDCYNVVWHGAYLKWFEIGRIELSQLLGIDFATLEQMEILLPVVELNCRYKSPGRLLDELCITTELKELKPASISFSHTVTNIKTGKVLLNALSTAVTTNKDGKLLRKMPDYLYDKYNIALNSQEKQVLTSTKAFE